MTKLDIEAYLLEKLLKEDKEIQQAVKAKIIQAVDNIKVELIHKEIQKCLLQLDWFDILYEVDYNSIVAPYIQKKLNELLKD